MSQKVEKVQNFLDPPPNDVDFFEFGKNLKFDGPPSDLTWEKFGIGKIWNFGNTPLEEKNIIFRTLKIDFQLKHLKSTFTPLIQIYSFEIDLKQVFTTLTKNGYEQMNKLSTS